MADLGKDTYVPDRRKQYTKLGRTAFPRDKRPGNRYGPHNVTWGSTAKNLHRRWDEDKDLSMVRLKEWENEYNMARGRNRDA